MQTDTGKGFRVLWFTSEWDLGKCHACQALGAKMSYFSSSANLAVELFGQNVQIYEFGTEKLNGPRNLRDVRVLPSLCGGNERPAEPS